jgi:hypothetical protein
MDPWSQLLLGFSPTEYCVSINKKRVCECIEDSLNFVGHCVSEHRLRLEVVAALILKMQAKLEPCGRRTLSSTATGKIPDRGDAGNVVLTTVPARRTCLSQNWASGVLEAFCAYCVVTPSSRA